MLCKVECWVQNLYPLASPRVDESKYPRGAWPSAFLGRLSKHLEYPLNSRTPIQILLPYKLIQVSCEAQTWLHVENWWRETWGRLSTYSTLFPCPAHLEGIESDRKVVLCYPHLALVQPSQEALHWLIDWHILYFLALWKADILPIKCSVTTSGESMFMTDIMNSYNFLNKLKLQHKSWISLITLT